MKPQPLRRSVGTSMMVYGVPGVGKTRLAGSYGRVCIIRPPTDSTNSINFEHEVEEMVVSNWSDMLEAQQYIFNEGHEIYDWVWLDSISLFQDFGLDDVLGDAIARKPARAIERGGQTIPEFGADKGEYKTNFDRLAKFCRDMSGVADEGKINFGITAHPFEWYSPILEEDIWMPWIQGKNMSSKICGYMNIVAYLLEVKKDEKQTQRMLLTEAPGFYGKDEFHAFPELKSGKRGLVSPSMEQITKLIIDAKGQKMARKKRIKKVRRKNNG